MSGIFSSQKNFKGKLQMNLRLLIIPQPRCDDSSPSTANVCVNMGAMLPLKGAKTMYCVFCDGLHLTAVDANVCEISFH